MPKRLAEKEIFKTKLFTIKDITLQFGKNKKVTYQILEKRDKLRSKIYNLIILSTYTKFTT